MIQLQNLSLHRGPRVLFEGADLALHAGWKTGITGANGSGKSSLFALLRGELHADRGDVQVPAAWRIAHVAQESPSGTHSALDYVLAGDAELAAVQTRLEAARAAHDGMAEAHLHERLASLDAYTAQARTAQLLHGLGFGAGEEHRPVDSFSGGWRMRLNLARALMARSDLLLLDEPTNHLDLDAVLWFEEWLRRYSGTLLLISHDRDFLDSVCDHVAHIEQQHVTLYNGNYTAFERRRAEQLAQQQAAYAKQQREITHIQSFVARFRAKATKARQAQSRLKALERMELIQTAHVDSPFSFVFPAPEACPNPLLSGTGLEVGYYAAEKPLSPRKLPVWVCNPDRNVSTAAKRSGAGHKLAPAEEQAESKIILHSVRFTLAPGSRIGLLGPNGAGKSTLIKLLADVLPPLAGELRAAQDLQIGYFAQHQMEQLDPGASPLLHLQRLSPLADEQSLRDFLGGFGFIGDMALAPSAPFSGGEKARLALALLVWQKPNLLLLDEPTNHLDLNMRDALALALQDYEGALVVVSHDRHLLRTVTDDWWLVAKGGVEPFDGDLEDYRRWLEQHRAAASDPGKADAAARQDTKQQIQAQRAQRRQAENRLKKLEQTLNKLGEEKTALEQILANPDLYQDRAKAEDYAQQLAALNARLEETETAWLEVSESLDL